ncbi:MAG: ABC transporter permease [Oscillospiraceae bacterium]|nr:ABC transporter permease [Oscillospiraceae bacterium]
MGKYFVKRVLLLIPTILLVCVIVFILMRMVPMDAVAVLQNKLSANGNYVDEDYVRALLGLDVPAVQQFFTWIGGVLQGDLGTSFFDHATVNSILARKLPVTLELGILSLIITNIISIPLGLFCAARQDSISDYTIRVFSTVLIAMPVFWVATMVLIYPNLWWGWAPAVSYVPFFEDPLENLSMFLLPAVISAIGQSGIQMRTIRTMTLEVMRQDYIRTAWAKGVPERQVLFKYAFRNSMIPIITMIGGSVAMMIGGNVVMENIFNIPGLGQALVSALNSRDYPIVQGCVLVLSLFVMCINLLVDLAYKWIDPRVTLD